MAGKMDAILAEMKAALLGGCVVVELAPHEVEKLVRWLDALKVELMVSG